MSEFLLQAQAITCTPRDTDLFGGLSLSLGRGEIVEIRGPNGSGKSTLLRILAGLQRPESGSVARDTERIAYIGHDSGLTGILSVVENLRWIAAMSAEKIATKDARESLARFGIASCMHMPVRSLSAGQTRRATLASLLIVDASVWLLDEPLASLDSDGAALLTKVAQEFVANGGAIIYATHVSLAVEIDRVIELAHK